MQTDKRNTRDERQLISVKGSREGELEIAHYPTKLTCSFCVSLTEEHHREAIFVLYRLRVKESSILFSKTYGLLGHTLEGHSQPSTQDLVTLYAQPAVMTMGKLSTIRVEYVNIPESEATSLMERAELEKEVCRPYFTKADTRHYEVNCTFYEAAAPFPEKVKMHHSDSRHALRLTMTYSACAVAAACIGVLLFRRSGITLETVRRQLPGRGGEFGAVFDALT